MCGLSALSTKDLNALVIEGKFSKALLHELQKTSLKMPSFATLSETEIEALAQGFAEQMTSNDQPIKIFLL